MDSRERREAVRALTVAYAGQIRINDFHDGDAASIVIEVPTDFLKKYLQITGPDSKEELPDPLGFWSYTKLERVVRKKAAGTDIEDHVDGVLFEIKDYKNSNGILDAEYVTDEKCPPECTLLQVTVDFQRDFMARVFSKRAEEAVEELEEQEKEERTDQKKAELKRAKREADGMMPRTPQYMHISGQASLELFENKKK